MLRKLLTVAANLAVAGTPLVAKAQIDLFEEAFEIIKEEVLPWLDPTNPQSATFTSSFSD